MRQTIQFHLDEHIDPAIADGLRRRQIEVTTTSGAGFLGAADEALLAFAAAERRVIVTNDSDFLRLHAEGIDHMGIIYCHQQNRSVGEIIRGLEIIWEVLEPEDLRNRVEFI